MQFHKDNRPTPYLNGRDQRRLLLMVATLGGVVWGISFAARPSNWYWLTGAPVEDASAAADRDHKPVDTHIDPDKDVLPPGGFRITGPGETAPRADAAQAAGNSTRLDPSLFAAVSDNSLGIRNSERESYYKILELAREIPDAQLESAADDEVTFAQMYTDPDDYRGRLVGIRGSVKRLTPLPALENDFGIDTVYEAWIVTPDSGNNPLVLHFTEIPEGIPTGSAVDLNCRFSGYFFKKYAYETIDGPHSTTMLLGKRLIWRRPPAAPVETGFAGYVLGLAIVMGGVVAIVVWRQQAGDRRFRRAHLDRIQQTAHESPAVIDVEPAEDFGQPPPDA